MKIFISVIFANLFQRCCKNSTILHMNFVNWFIFIIKLCCVQELNSKEMRNNSYILVFLAVLPQNFFHLSCSFSYIWWFFPQSFIIHKLCDFVSFFLIFDSLKVDLLQELEVLLLVFIGVIFYKPKLPLWFNFWKIKFGKLLFLHLYTSTNFWTMLKSLT